MLKNIALSIITIIATLACNVTKKKADAKATETINLLDVKILAPRYEPALPYQASRTVVNDLLHTKLNVQFDYINQYLLGKATLTFKPYWYNTQNVLLDAKAMDILYIGLIDKRDTLTLKYDYTNEKLNIQLNKTYTRNDTFKLYINYVAKPNKVTQKGSDAISEAKGLYFINPINEDPEKPRQIWTQGETESNSCWFPTIDAPNEKHTQEIYITANDNDVTLSNGLLIYNKQNSNGTHTDYWKQDKPHAVYLTMMAVGNFAIVKDKWRGKMEVNYYVEKAYEQYAKMIFGNTPEMLDAFSKRLGVDYPWDKYSQIVVRDYVSGAMENTGAVVHGEMLQHNAREHLDNNYEDYISHELFHHWFGDLVTAESWSNLPLNESFATYGEYIWQEYKYGRMYADMEFETNMNNYLRSKNKHKTIPIRYQYKSHEDMFDAVSYAKGGRILHMLRYAIGNDAFFASLKLYLTKYAYKSAEIHNLRMCFEEITGQDMNWFFNQWFLKAGHPQLDINYSYSNNRKTVSIITKQVQDSSVGLYQIPLALNLFMADKTQTESIELKHKIDTFTYTTSQAISLADIDAERVLLAIVKENKTINEYIYQLQNAPNFIAKKQAINAIINTGKIDTLEIINAIKYCINHPFYGVKDLGLNLLSKQKLSIKQQFEKQILALINYKEQASIRADAISTLADINKQQYKPQIMQALNDSAYSVVSSALAQLVDLDEAAALQFCKQNEQSYSGTLQANIASVYSMVAKDNKNDYFKNQINKSGNYTYTIIGAYGKYLKTQSDTVKAEGIDIISNYVQKGKIGYNSFAVKNVVKDMLSYFDKRLKELEKNKDNNSQWYQTKLNILAEINAKLD